MLAPSAAGIPGGLQVGLTGASPGRRIAAPDRWEDGRPTRWPTLQLRVRGKPFDVYCEHASDVTLDGMGIPVINGHTVTGEDLKRGWFDSRLLPQQPKR
jgi:hypothetical protein